MCIIWKKKIIYYGSAFERWSKIVRDKGYLNENINVLAIFYVLSYAILFGPTSGLYINYVLLIDLNLQTAHRFGFGLLQLISWSNEKISGHLPY
jgi:hypothetical protein